jgi:hypothetical protein
VAHAKKEGKWFIKTRGSYLPNSWQGWLTYIPFLAYLVGALVYALHSKYSVWQGLFWLVPNYVAAAAIMTWLAFKKS